MFPLQGEGRVLEIEKINTPHTHTYTKEGDVRLLSTSFESLTILSSHTITMSVLINLSVQKRSRACF